MVVKHIDIYTKAGIATAAGAGALGPFEVEALMIVLYLVRVFAGAVLGFYTVKLLKKWHGK